MRIIDLSIENFRGIKACSVSFPTSTRVICMIGAGDSTKSTLLKAIEWVLWPSWSLPVGDGDFFQGNTDESITIVATFTEIPEELLAEGKFGFYLRKIGVPYEADLDDEPTDDAAMCLSVRLKIDSQLEPTWDVVTNRGEPKPISHYDRKKMQLGVIGSDFDKDLTWGRFSVLQKYADSKSAIQQAYASTLRDALKLADFDELDSSISVTLTEIGQMYGVELATDIKNRMIVQSGLFLSSLGVFEGDVPLWQRGKGSRRLLSIGLNITAFDGSTLLLVDEIEAALEPYRIRSLINELRNQLTESGQVIMTTHSPVVVAECTLDEIMIIQSNDSETTAYSLASQNESINSSLQAEIRRNPESFLCKRIIVCEGKTEIGFVRAMDAMLSETMSFRMAHKGVGVALGEGSNIFSCAETLLSCGYDVCILIDSDRREDNQKIKALSTLGIHVFRWEDNKAIEEQIFCDIPPFLANKIINIAVSDRGIESIKSILDNNGIKYVIEDDQIFLSGKGKDVLAQIGSLSKEKSWFKQIGLGEAMTGILFQHWHLINEDTCLKQTVNDLINWIRGND